MKILLLATLMFSFLSFAPDQKKDKKPWKYIFNGKDFTNWKIVGGTGVAEIIDSAINCHMTANTKEHTFVCTQEKYDDFILELDVNADQGYNTGILLRCIDKPLGCDTCKVRLYGYQIKVDPSPTRRWTGGIFDDFGASWRWLYDLSKDERAQKASTIGAWNHFRVEAIGSSIKVWVNDVPTTHLIDQKYSKGYIALKIHSLNDLPEEEKKIGRFKNIRIITRRPSKYLEYIDLPARKANNSL
jgi:hypothetical protein